MTTYTAYFRTQAEYATEDFDAETPEQALQMARAFLEDHDDELTFVDYDDLREVEEIEVYQDGERLAEDSVALWQSDTMRVRLAASELLEALQAARDFVQDELEMREHSGDSAYIGAVQKLLDVIEAALAKATPKD